MAKPSVPVTLQITLAPSDFRHAKVLLEHQVRTWRDQVDEILLTIDFHRSPGRFSDRWAEGEHHILPLAESVAGARTVAVDYAPAARARVSREFFSGAAIPEKDFRGGPFYSYFFGLTAARNDHVLHTDSDMFFGGGSQTWLAEAITLMDAAPDTLLTAPLSGPPAPDGHLRQLQATPEAQPRGCFRFNVMSSRLFLLRRSRFRERIGALRPRAPRPWKNVVIAALEGNPRADLPEHLFTDAMQKHQVFRREFLGREPGMWSLHPPYRSADFYRRLPELVARVESGNLPAAQWGDHDLNDCLVDWSEPRAALRRNRIWRRLWFRHFGR